VIKFLERIVYEEREISTEAWWVTVVHFFYGAAGAIGGLFINIFLWKQSNDFLILIRYNLFNYALTLGAFLLIRHILKRVRLGPLMQVGLFILLLEYVLLIIFHENVTGLAWFLGILNGLGGGLYWAGHNIFEYLSTANEDRDAYFGLNSSLGYLISVIFPTLGGFLIAQTLVTVPAFGPSSNYYLLFFFVAVILLAGILLVLKLPSFRLPATTRSYLSIARESSVWRLIGWREFLDGLKGGALGFLVSVLTFIILDNSELSVGVYTSVFALLSGAVAIYVGKRLAGRTRHRLASGLFGAGLLAASQVVYVAFFNFFGVILSGVINILGQPLFNVGLASTFYQAIDKSPEYRTGFFEYMIAREIPLALGRILSVVAFFLFLKFGTGLGAAKTWFVILGFVPFAFWFLTKKFEKTLAENIQPEI
jgi:MFS transporter, YQGE family, putative transporter